MIHIAVIGDIHGQFDMQDVAYFNQSDDALLLFVGDLASYRHREGTEVAKVMSRLAKPALYIPGNHDAVHALQLLAEIKQSKFWSNTFSPGLQRRMQQLQKAIGTVTVCGYSTHSFEMDGMAFDVIAGRPFAMGGSHFSYAAHLQRTYGIDSMAASAQRLKQCVDAAQSNQLIFLAHNGPTGLGTAKTAMWGCDFRPEAGDFGDWDLQQAIDYAKQQGKRVPVVLAGHMHHQIKGGGLRKWQQRIDETTYVNTARVPRIFMADGGMCHHHVRLSVEETAVTVQEMLVWSSKI